MLLLAKYKPFSFVSIFRSLADLYGEAPLDSASDTKSSRKDNDSSTCSNKTSKITSIVCFVYSDLHVTVIGIVKKENNNNNNKKTRAVSIRDINW